MTWSAYHRTDDMHGYLEYLAKTYPDICSVQDIGHSKEGRPLKVLRLVCSYGFLVFLLSSYRPLPAQNIERKRKKCSHLGGRRNSCSRMDQSGSGHVHDQSICRRLGESTQIHTKHWLVLFANVQSGRLRVHAHRRSVVAKKSWRHRTRTMCRRRSKSKFRL